jgi:hypothetical protein
MTLSKAQRLFLVTEQVIGPAIINFILNALIVWLVFRPSESVPVWGDPGVAFDVSSTMFILPLITCLITTPLVRRAVRSGKVPPLSWGPSDHALLRRLPGGLFLRSATLGLITTVITAPAILAILAASGLETVPLVEFAVAKGLFCAAIAMLVTPLAALYALAQVSGSARAGA